MSTGCPLESRRPSQAGRLTSDHAERDLPPMRCAAVFEKKDALPGAKLHPAVDDRDHFARAGEDGANVRSAVVAPFRSVLEPRRVLRHEPLEKFLEIASRRGIGVFHDDEAAARVPNENGDGACDDPTLADCGRDLIGEFVGALAFGRNDEMRGFDMQTHSARVAVETSGGNDLPNDREEDAKSKRNPSGANRRMVPKLGFAPVSWRGKSGLDRFPQPSLREDP